jgi:hypothetical protein
MRHAVPLSFARRPIEAYSLPTTAILRGGPTVDDARRQVLLDELTDAKRERDRLSLYIETLSVRLGVDADNDEVRSEKQVVPIGEAPMTADPSTLIYENEFVGLSFPKAAEEVLTRFSPPPHKRPLKTVQLTKALQKGGLDLSSPSVLYRSLHKHSRFHSLGRGTWGLSDWYPAAVRSKARKGSPTPTVPEEAGQAPEPSGETDSAGVRTDLPSQNGEGPLRSEEAVS